MAVVGAVTMGMGSLNFGLYIKPMGDELSIGRASFGWASSARSATGAITGPFIGRLLDRYGPKWILVSAAVHDWPKVHLVIMATHNHIRCNGAGWDEWSRIIGYLRTTNKMVC